MPRSLSRRIGSGARRFLPCPRGLPPISAGSASTTSLSRPAQASLALRPARLLTSPRADFVTRLRSGQLPSRTACPLPRPTDNYMGGSFRHWRFAPLGRTEISGLDVQAATSVQDGMLEPPEELSEQPVTTAPTPPQNQAIGQRGAAVRHVFAPTTPPTLPQKFEKLLACRARPGACGTVLADGGRRLAAQGSNAFR